MTTIWLLRQIVQLVLDFDYTLYQNVSISGYCPLLLYVQDILLNYLVTYLPV